MALEALFARAGVPRGRGAEGISELWWLDASILHADASGDVEASELHARRLQKAALRAPLVAAADTYDPKTYLTKAISAQASACQPKRKHIGSLPTGPEMAAELLEACRQGDEQLLKRLLRRHDAKELLRYVEAGTQKTALHVAARYGHEGACAQLLEQGVDVHAPDKHGRSPLAVACMHARPLAAKQLLQARALPWQWDNMERNALHLACCSNDPTVPQVVLSSNPRLVNTPDGLGRTCLWYCISSVHAKQRQLLMKQLLNSRADVNIADAYGRTPVWFASRRGIPSLVSLLLEYRADLNLCDQDGLSALDVARGALTRACLDVDYGSGVPPHVTKRELASDMQDMLKQVRNQVAEREQMIDGFRTKLQDFQTPLIDVTGSWVCNHRQTLIKLRQDPLHGDIAGEICSLLPPRPGLLPNRPPIQFHGRVVEDKLIYSTGPRHQPTTFTLRLVEGGQVLEGTWQDFRGASGDFKMRACSSVPSPTGEIIAPPLPPPPGPPPA